MDATISDVHAEIKARHGHSMQPESLQLKAILQAVTEVIQAQGMEVTPLTLFAATMSALEKPESLASPQVRAGAAVGRVLRQVAGPLRTCRPVAAVL